MTRPVRLVAIGIVLMQTVCSEAPTSTEENLNQHKILLGERDLSISLPHEATVQVVNESVEVKFGPEERRYIASMRLALAGIVKLSDEFPLSITLNDGAQLAYRVLIYNGGSGGTEFGLAGVITWKDLALQVTCHQQEEPLILFKPKLDWCVPYLQSLTLHETGIK